MNELEPALRLRELLLQAGFHGRAIGQMRRGNVSCRLDRDWAELWRPASRPADPATWWRPSGDGDTEICEIPLWFLSADAGSDRPLPDLARFLDCILHAREPDAASATAFATWSASVPATLWSVVAADGVHRIETVAGPADCRLRTRLGTIVRALTPRRMRWCDDVVARIQRNWRLLRCSHSTADAAVLAQIDFTGVPADWIEPLGHIAIGVLHGVTKAQSGALLALLDPTLEMETERDEHDVGDAAPAGVLVQGDGRDR